MPIKGYGVWVATPTVFTAERTGRSPHGNLIFTDGSTKYKQLSSAINVKSTGTDSRLVYWSNRDFQHAITQKLQSLDKGFHPIAGSSDQGPDGIALDILRGNLVDLNKGTILPTNAEGPDNDIVDHLTEIFSDAITAKATVYLWGQQYSPTPNGIHDIHMNQGNSGKASWTRDNGIYQDGSFMLKYPDGHWEAVFLAFASQATKTDDGGQPERNAKTFAQLLNDPAQSDTRQNQDNRGQQEGHAQRGHQGHHGHHGHAGHGKHHELSRFATESPSKSSPITAGVTTHDDTKLAGHVRVHDAEQKRDMKGWSVIDQDGRSHGLTSAEAHSISEGDPVDLQDLPLRPEGGSISLKDAEGKLVSEVVYSKFLKE
jgi:uncharacterized protein YukJ